MYKLYSSDENNNDVIKIAEENKEKFLGIASLNKISYIIFNEKIDDALFRKLKIYLTLSDEFQIPISKNAADILFFTTCINHDDKIELNIKNLSQAKILFDLYENNFKKVQPEENSSRVRFTELKTDHNILFPGTFLVWKIPVGFFRSSEGQKVTLSGSAFCLLDVNGEEFKIPRSIFLKFFKGALVKGRIVCDSTDEIKEVFDITNKEALEETFCYIGFSLKQELKNIEVPLGHILVKDNKIFCYVARDIKPNSHLWINVRDSEYVLLPRLNYIALKSSNMDLVSLLS